MNTSDRDPVARVVSGGLEAGAAHDDSSRGALGNSTKITGVGPGRRAREAEGDPPFPEMGDSPQGRASVTSR